MWGTTRCRIEAERCQPAGERHATAWDAEHVRRSGPQEAAADPDVPPGREVLCDVQWLRLRDVPERDRAFLWAAGLLGVGRFLRKVRSWGDDTSYPDPERSHVPAGSEAQ
jgi:hypothetical protein